MAESKNIGIIGSGVAGLATAVRMAAKGHRVTVFEKEDVLGGKMGQIEKKGFRFDSGPSLFTQPYLMDELLKLSGKEKGFSYQKMDISCKYFWEDGTVFSAYEDKGLLKKELEEVFPKEVKRFLNRLEDAKRSYESVGKIFIKKPLNKWSTWLSADVLKALPKLPSLNLNASMHQANKSNFDDDKVTQLFDRFATYNGSNPYKAPALLNMIPHLELNEGTYYPQGGLRKVPDTLIKLGEQMGVKYRKNEGVNEIEFENNRVTGIQTEKGSYQFDTVVSNADVYPTYKSLLKGVEPPKKVLHQERSSSGIIFYWGIKKSFPQLDLHNIFFSESYEEEFAHLFDKGQVFEDPTIYVNISSKVDKDDAPEGCENWFVLINAPANKGQDWDDAIKQVRKSVLLKLERVLGENIENLIAVEELLDPRSIERKTSSFQGSLYGTSSNNKYAAFMRHSNDHQQFKNLFFCGGSVHPGGGIPLCLNSARIVSELIK